jgi:hypothetical protein
MSAHLRRIIDLGPGGVIQPGSAHDYRFHDNRRYFEETATPWARLWADWPSLQPDPAYAPDDPRSPGADRLAALDDQIRAACLDGVSVLLMPYRFPLWANGSTDLSARRNTDDEVSFRYWDRMEPAAWLRYLALGRDPGRYNPPRRALEFRVPAGGVGPGSDWARFFAFLHDRYHRGRRDTGRWVEGFELLNEPNWQLWPQRGPSETGDPFAPGPLTAPGTTARFILTAQAISAAAGHSTLLFAPSTSDSETSTRVVTPYDAFTTGLLDALDAAGYRPHAGQAWSHHNYTDLERRSADTRTQRLRALLAGRWDGYREGPGPTVFITEGGARTTRMRSYYPAEDPLEAQASSVRDGWARHATDDGAGAGVAMLAQYQTYADPRFDTGLLDPWPAVMRRPVYGVWASLPRYA